VECICIVVACAFVAMLALLLGCEDSGLGCFAVHLIIKVLFIGPLLLQVLQKNSIECA